MEFIRMKKKQICIILGIFFAVTVVACAGIRRKDFVDSKIMSMQEKLAEEVFRFHVLANSDSKEDQALKMKVKERVLSYMKEELPESESADITKKWANEHIEEIEEIAYQTIVDEGYDYGVNVKVTECYFPEKRYGDVVFPAGDYEALRIEIGEAEGQNWWCVLYPNLCFIDAVHAVVPEEGKAVLEHVLDEDEYEMVTAMSRFKIKWFFFQ